MHRFGVELRGALLNDENSAGLTPPVVAIKVPEPVSFSDASC